MTCDGCWGEYLSKRQSLGKGTDRAPLLEDIELTKMWGKWGNTCEWEWLTFPPHIQLKSQACTPRFFVALDNCVEGYCTSSQGVQSRKSS